MCLYPIFSSLFTSRSSHMINTDHKNVNMDFAYQAWYFWLIIATTTLNVFTLKASKSYISDTKKNVLFLIGEWNSFAYVSLI